MTTTTMNDTAHGKKATKKRSRGTSDPNAILKLRWDLHELPSSQHRAGLAGLALCVGYLRRKPDRKGVCELENIDEHGLTLIVDRQGMQGLFDDLYDATIEEARSKAKWPGADPKRIDEVEIKDEKTGKSKTEKRFVYDKVVPAGSIVSDWDAAPSGSPKLWLKLWQDLVWTTLRGVPATREPFNARAERRAVDDGGEAWDDLATKPETSIELPSTYALGAQARSAENVAFEDITRMRFLLHFWSVVVAIYIPAVLQRDGKREFIGYPR